MEKRHMGKIKIPVMEMTRDSVLTGSGHSSKGNQLKWEKDGYWYKADALGYEGLAEVVVSAMLRKTDIKDFVEYEPVFIGYHGKYYRGCRSRNFRQQGEEIVTLEKLYRMMTGMSLAMELAHFAETKQRIVHTVKFVENVTGLQDFGAYLAKLLEIDGFFLNEDRHTNNIALLYHAHTDTYRPCPFFDMGLSLFADLTDSFPVEDSYEKCLKKIEAKPFSRDFLEQMDAADTLYGDYLCFDMSRYEVYKLIDDLKEKYEAPDGLEWYSKEEWGRVENTLAEQAHSYSYAFRK